jgi:hypothetical protein
VLRIQCSDDGGVHAGMAQREFQHEIRAVLAFPEQFVQASLFERLPRVRALNTGLSWLTFCDAAANYGSYA